MNGMAFVILTLGALILLPLIWAIATYNRLVSTRQQMKESWSGVDIELKRRHDLIPNLVSTVKGYAAHESDIFEKVASLRAQAMSITDHGGARAQAEGELAKTLGRLVGVAERYPRLKADANFLELQKELALTEDRIAAGRRFYNANVRELNTLSTTFPSNVLAGMFGFTIEEFFELEHVTERAVPATF
ncbi:MAG: LemA family protein [Phycisphaerae bacterium]|nr:LemA family protein [Phycisphaerae bacterium]